MSSMWSLSIKNPMTHFRLIHADEPNFRIDCTLQGCCRTFKNFHTYRNHIYAFHSTSIDSLDLSQAFETVSEEVCAYDSDNDSDSENNGNVTSLIDISNQLPDDAASIQRSAAIWTLKVREKYCLSQSAMEHILKDVDSLYKVATMKVRHNITYV